MRKGGRPAEQHQVAQDAGVILEMTEKKFLSNCRSAISAVLPKAYVDFRQAKTSHPGREVWCMVGQPASAARSGYTETVLPLLVLGCAEYWVGVLLEFGRDVRGRNVRLAGITVTLMVGAHSDPVKSPLVRVDWDCGLGYREVKHAQPHWHVHPDWLALGATAPAAGFRAEDDAVEFPSPHTAVPPGVPWSEGAVRFGGPPTEVPTLGEPANAGLEIARFHFALAAQWQDDSSQNPSLTADQVPQWIARCIDYTRTQLIYLHKKAGEESN